MGGFDDSGFQRTLGDMLARASNPEKPLNEIGFLMVQRMKQNFADQASVVPWPMSKRAEKKGGETLRDSGTLMNLIVSEVQGNDGVAAGPTAVGRERITDPRVLAALDLGATIHQFARSERFVRNRISRGPRQGQFKRGTSEGKGMTFGDRVIKIFPYHYTYIPEDTFVTFGEIMQRFILAGQLIKAGHRAGGI